MKNFIKGSMVAAAMLMGASSFAQIQDENNVTVTMELVPVLQLNMNTTDQISFVFDEIPEYIGGITKYGATILTVSSTVNWDLFASGTSGVHNATPANRNWDFVVGYGPSAVTTSAAGARNALPLTALELRQFPSTTVNDAATGTQTAYYNTAFAAATSTPIAWPNNIYVSTGSPYLSPSEVTDPYIAGGQGLTNFINGGTYLTQTTAVGTSKYYFVIDYRIVPGLPAIFPLAGTTVGADASHNLVTGAAFNATTTAGVGAYAKPGVYTMNVKYLLIENQ
jgi:hypothetical protein